jgi:pimeloyl-ACP methyl ester carboxylesterase
MRRILFLSFGCAMACTWGCTRQGERFALPEPENSAQSQLPDTVKPQSIPIQLETKTGAIHGALDLPAGAGPHSAVVIIAGSGPTDRDGNQNKMKNDSLKMLGAGLAAHGIAAVRFDKRGVAESLPAGTREDKLRFETYVQDAADWVKFLRKDSRFGRVGIVGHSEGALIGMAAAKKTKIDAFVSIAGSGRRAPDALREQLTLRLLFLPDLKKQNDKILDELTAGRTVSDIPNELMVLYRPSVQPYLISWFKYDPVREIASLSMPVLIVQGTTDVQIPVKHAELLAKTNKSAKLKIIDGMNHVLKESTGLGSYNDPSLPLHPALLKEVVPFLTKAFGNSPPRESKRKDEP